VQARELRSVGEAVGAASIHIHEEPAVHENRLIGFAREGRLALAALALLMLPGCELIGDIFKAGMWFGIILVVAIVIAVGYAVSRFRGRD
jgi:hypothetical protein